MGDKESTEKKGVSALGRRIKARADDLDVSIKSLGRAVGSERRVQNLVDGTSQDIAATALLAVAGELRTTVGCLLEEGDASTKMVADALARESAARNALARARRLSEIFSRALSATPSAQEQIIQLLESQFNLGADSTLRSPAQSERSKSRD